MKILIFILYNFWLDTKSRGDIPIRNVAPITDHYI